MEQYLPFPPGGRGEPQYPINDGDIFRWSYREESGRVFEIYGYHCKSRIAVAKNGRLYDTYWHGGSETSWWTFDQAHEKLILEFEANFADLEKKPEWMAEYYDEDDIVNLNHANSSRDNFYIRKGAKRSRAKMLEIAAYKKERAEGRAKSELHTAQLMAEVIAKIEAGEPLDGLYL